MNIAKAIKKYLDQYAEAEAEEASRFADLLQARDIIFEHAICLPCFSEPVAHLHQLLSFLAEEKNCLAIVVLNQPGDLSPSDNAYSLAKNALWQREIENTQRADHNLMCEGAFTRLLRIDENYLIVVNRYSPHTIPRQQGVGLARKIGSDIALTLYNRGLLKTRWLHSSDTDCILPSDYFASSNRWRDENDVAALVYPFQHIDGSGNAVSLHHHDEVVQATALYEKKLHQYVNGLTCARSTYNHHSIGSCICVSLPHYAMCRGFPALSAGEDFYLLNKIRKLGRIKEVESKPIRIHARQSKRTPFGTGAAVADILNHENPLQAEIFYPQSLFVALRFFLVWMETLSTDRCAEDVTTWPKSLLDFWRRVERRLQRRLHKRLHKEANEQSAQSSILPPASAVLRATQSIHFERAIVHCLAQTHSKNAFSLQLSFWFDGFRTLRWLHSLRDESGMTMLAIETDQTSEK